MGEEVLGIVPAGVEMKLVPNALGKQLLVKLDRSLSKTQFVLCPAINVDGFLFQLDWLSAGEIKRVVFLPVANINGIAEHRS